MLVSTLGGAAALAAPSAALDCSWPQGRDARCVARVDGAVLVRSDAALVDTVWVSPIYGDAVQVGFDFTTGDAGAAVNGTASHDIELVAPDDFELQGVPAGVPLTIGAELAVTLSGCCDWPFFLPWVQAALEGADAPLQLTAASVSFAQTLAGTVSLPASVRQFRLTFRLEGGNGARYGGVASFGGRWRFTGLPAGATVVSCKGFAGEQVPTRPATWGALKARYR